MNWRAVWDLLEQCSRVEHVPRHLLIGLPIPLPFLFWSADVGDVGLVDGVVVVAAIRALGRHRLLDLTAGLARGARCVLLRSAFGNGPLPCSRPWRLAPAELPKKAFIDNHVTRRYVRRSTIVVEGKLPRDTLGSS